MGSGVAKRGEMGRRRWREQGRGRRREEEFRETGCHLQAALPEGKPPSSRSYWRMFS